MGINSSAILWTPRPVGVITLKPYILALLHVRELLFSSVNQHVQEHARKHPIRPKGPGGVQSNLPTFSDIDGKALQHGERMRECITRWSAGDYIVLAIPIIEAILDKVGNVGSIGRRHSKKICTAAPLNIYTSTKRKQCKKTIKHHPYTPAHALYKQSPTLLFKCHHQQPSHCSCCI